MRGWELIGHCDVDAGLLYLGDPCYLSDNNLFADWQKFCDLIPDNKEGFTIGHSGEVDTPGKEGMGVVVSTGYGDGTYGVYAQIKQGRVMQVMVDFEQLLTEDEEKEV